MTEALAPTRWQARQHVLPYLLPALFNADVIGWKKTILFLGLVAVASTAGDLIHGLSFT